MILNCRQLPPQGLAHRLAIWTGYERVHDDVARDDPIFPREGGEERLEGFENGVVLCAGLLVARAEVHVGLLELEVVRPEGEVAGVRCVLGVLSSAPRAVGEVGVRLRCELTRAMKWDQNACLNALSSPNRSE